jgi:hypothetical protein
LNEPLSALNDMAKKLTVWPVNNSYVRNLRNSWSALMTPARPSAIPLNASLPERTTSTLSRNNEHKAARSVMLTGHHEGTVIRNGQPTPVKRNPLQRNWLTVTSLCDDMWWNVVGRPMRRRQGQVTPIAPQKVPEAGCQRPRRRQDVGGERSSGMVQRSAVISARARCIR